MRNHRLIFALGLLILSCSQSTFAKDNGHCSERIIAQIGKHFSLDHFSYPADGMYPGVENGGLIVAGACKQWHSDKSKFIAAFAYDSGDGGKANDPFVYLLIATVDWQKNQVIGSYKSLYYLGPGGIGSLKIDTAPYRLSDSVTAFGLDIESGYSHNCGDGGTGAERALYVQEGRSIRPILQIPAMSWWRHIKGSRCGPDVAEEIVENIHLSIEVANSATKGYQDLVITAKSSRTDRKPTGKGRFRHTLHYDGKQYPILEMEKPFYRWETGRREP